MRRVIWFGGFVGLLLLLYGRPLAALAVHAANSDLHSYILLVPLISLYLVYLRREELPKDFVPASGMALGFFLAGVVAAALASPWTSFGRALSPNDHLGIMAFSFICLLGGGGLLFLGQSWMKTLAFPFVFLLFLIPLPDHLADLLENASKVGSTEAANFFFTITGTSFLRDGPVFQLPNITIEVAKECSGIRSSWILMIASVLAANLFLRSPWRRLALVLFTIPLGILRNGFRIWTIGTLCIHIGPQMIHSPIHRQGGPLFFTLSLGPLFLFLWWLRRSEARRAAPTVQDMGYATPLPDAPPDKQVEAATRTSSQ